MIDEERQKNQLDIHENAIDGEMIDRGILSEVSDPETKKIASVVRSLRISSGPIPDPSILKEYDEVHEGLADRIVRMAESEQLHRHKMEAIETKEPFKIAKLGQWFGLFSIVVAFGFAGFLAFTGNPGWGTAVAAIDVVALAAVFVTGQKEKNRTNDGAEDSE